MSEKWYVCGTCDTRHSTQGDMASCCPTTRVKSGEPPEKGRSPRKSVREAHREHIRKTTEGNWRKRRR